MNAIELGKLLPGELFSFGIADARTYQIVKDPNGHSDNVVAYMPTWYVPTYGPYYSLSIMKVYQQ